MLLVRRLQDGDPGGHMRRALAAFPAPEIAESILGKYYGNVKKPESARYKNAPPLNDLLSSIPERVRAMYELSIAANYVEVWLAREGHDGPIGINHLEKIQLLHLARLYGAMLAEVDYVLRTPTETVALEIKSGKRQQSHKGLQEFAIRYPKVRCETWDFTRCLHFLSTGKI